MKTKSFLLLSALLLLLASSCRTYHCRVMPQLQNPELSKAVPEAPAQTVAPTKLERKADKAVAFVQKMVQDTNIQKGMPFVKQLVKFKQNPRVKAKLDRLQKNLSDSLEGGKDLFSDENVKWMSIGSLIAIPVGTILSYATGFTTVAAVATILSGVAGLIGLLGLIAAIMVFVVVRKNKGKYSKNTEILAKTTFWIHIGLLILGVLIGIALLIFLASLANNGNC